MSQNINSTCFAPRTVLRHYPAEDSTEHSTIVVLKSGRFYDTDTKVHYDCYEDWKDTLDEGIIYVNARNAVDQVRVEKEECLRVQIKAIREIRESPSTWAKDGRLYPWIHEGKNYYRNCYNDVWLQESNVKGYPWCGVYIPRENRFNTDIEEPVFDKHYNYIQTRVPNDGRSYMWDGDYSVWRPFSLYGASTAYHAKK